MAARRYSDDELLRALSDSHGIEEPVKFIYREFYGLLSHYIETNDGSRQDAEDVFQETVLCFIELVRAGKFRGDSAVKTFLYAINRNIWLNEKKKTGRREKRHGLAAVADEQFPEIDGYLNRRESRKQIFSIIDSLGDICKKILIGFYYEELSIADILTRLNYENEQVVRNKKAKCMKDLQEKFRADPTLAGNMKKALRYE